MYAAVTATRQGLTPAQLATIERILVHPRIRVCRLTHGDAPGGDAQIHELALQLGIRVRIRPSTHPERAWCEGADEVLEPKPPLERNRDIADDGGLLIAAPAGYEEERRSGTWSTVRYARKIAPQRGKAIAIVWPDGRTGWEKTPPPAPRPPPPAPPPGPDPSLLPDPPDRPG